MFMTKNHMGRLRAGRSAGLAICIVALSSLLITEGESFLGAAKPQSAPRRLPMCFTKKPETEERDYERKTWNPLRLLVLRLGFTEPAMTSPLNYGKYEGEFTCAYCGQTLFDATSKYDSGSGWPSFWRSANEDAVAYKKEFDGRLECKCKRCNSHLGHVFLDGPRPATVPRDLLETSPKEDPRGASGKYLPRFCVNGASLRFQDRGKTTAE